MFMAAGYAAVQGGKAVKHQVERRKNSTLDGDFLVTNADPTKNQRRGLKDCLEETKQSFVVHTNVMRRSLQRMTSSMSKGSTHTLEDGSEHSPPLYAMGQEVELQNMEDAQLNGTKALVLADYGGSKGVLAQFMFKKEGYDNYHESGMLVKHENIVAGDINNQDNVASETGSSIVIPAIGAMIELKDLTAIHMNGLRGMVMEPSNDIKEGRVAVQLLEGSAALISVKPENCRIIAPPIDDDHLQRNEESKFDSFGTDDASWLQTQMPD